jgi:hypothetical protein
MTPPQRLWLSMRIVAAVTVANPSLAFRRSFRMLAVTKENKDGGPKIA